MHLDMRDPGNALCWSGPPHLQDLACHMSAGRSVALNISMDGSTGSQLSARSAQLEAVRAQAAQRLSQRQRVLSRKRREAALAAKAAMIERMQRDIAAADAEIQVCGECECWQTELGIDQEAFMRNWHSNALLAGLHAKQWQFRHDGSTRPGACQHMEACLGSFHEAVHCSAGHSACPCLAACPLLLAGSTLCTAGAEAP